MLTTYSELHAAILDEFNTAGVEIMSPHYRALGRQRADHCTSRTLDTARSQVYRATGRG